MNNMLISSQTVHDSSPEEANRYVDENLRSENFVSSVIKSMSYTNGLFHSIQFTTCENCH